VRFRLVSELAADGVSVAVAYRVLRVSTSGYYEWRDRARPPSWHAVVCQRRAVCPYPRRALQAARLHRQGTGGEMVRVRNNASEAWRNGVGIPGAVPLFR
jgi:hypothetical protein